ncbi:hypothetical protein [Leisingera sp. ANG-Vp]|uniref:hypothetical protein n=1 Tax=Leisingera sp. ANG-Vp TaxID=1577896 RepID=UPI0006892470|nr:hypothetical protein [Leisingera sp. ANG-Vp]
MSDKIVYFDGCTTFGKAGGNIQVELQANLLDPKPNGSVEVRSEVTARLRCSRAAALQLIEALRRAVDLAGSDSDEAKPVKN